MSNPGGRRLRVEDAAKALVYALEAHHELGIARDRIGDKKHDEARRRLIDALIDFGREIAMAARDR